MVRSARQMLTLAAIFAIMPTASYGATSSNSVDGIDDAHIAVHSAAGNSIATASKDKPLSVTDFHDHCPGGGNRCTNPGPWDGPQEIPRRVNARCRWAYRKEDIFNESQTRKTTIEIQLYRLFMSTEANKHGDWCRLTEMVIKNNCFYNETVSVYGIWDIEWRRCDPESKDLLWQKGYVASFAVKHSTSLTNDCIATAMAEAAQGAMVDWLGAEGCYAVPLQRYALDW